MRLEQRRSLPHRMIGTSAKVCVAVAALVGAANWAAKGYPDRATAPGAVAALAAEEPITTGSITPRLVGSGTVPVAEKPVEKIVARVPDFDQRALALLAGGAKADTTPAAKSIAATKAAVATKASVVSRKKEASAH